MTFWDPSSLYLAFRVALSTVLSKKKFDSKLSLFRWLGHWCSLLYKIEGFSIFFYNYASTKKSLVQELLESKNDEDITKKDYVDLVSLSDEPSNTGGSHNFYVSRLPA